LGNRFRLTASRWSLFGFGFSCSVELDGFGCYSFLFELDAYWIEYIWTIVGSLVLDLDVDPIPGSPLHGRMVRHKIPDKPSRRATAAAAEPKGCQHAAAAPKVCKHAATCVLHISMSET
jgi:hypothetical protein